MNTKIAAVLMIVIALAVTAASITFGETRSDGYQTTNGVNAGPGFPVNTHRYDPYKQFKFAVKWDNQYILGVSKVSGLGRITEALDEREGLDPNIDRISPGLTRYQPIILERGLTHDRAFEEWANMVWTFGAGAGNEMSLQDYRKDIRIELRNEAGQTVMAWMVYRCWPSEYVALAGLDANNADIAIERLTLQHEGWERDLEVTEPVEP